MSQPVDSPAWWQWHLRIARGETLAADEQQLYDAEVRRQDREAAHVHGDLKSLWQLREQVGTLSQGNSALRSRLGELEQEIHRVEGMLSQESRQVLGVSR
jgi:predicted RNase H-like nuclease (RuvC/YqgF family)